MVAGAFGDTLYKVLEVVLRCPVADGAILLGIMPALMGALLTKGLAARTFDKETMKAMPAAVANVFDRITELAKRNDKPVIVASDLFTDDEGLVQEINRVLAGKNHVFYALPHQAAAVFARLARYGEYLRQNSAENCSE
jgi:hypothetical protein